MLKEKINLSDIVYLPLDELIPNEKNYRIHTEGQISQLVKSVKKYGQLRPIIVHKETKKIVAGHALYQALKIAFPDKPAACVYCNSDEKTALEIMYVDNKIFQLGKDDFYKKFDVLKELDFNIEIPGLDEYEIAYLKNLDNIFSQSESGVETKTQTPSQQIEIGSSVKQSQGNFSDNKYEYLPTPDTSTAFVNAYHNSDTVLEEELEHSKKLVLEDTYIENVSYFDNNKIGVLFKDDEQFIKTRCPFCNSEFVVKTDV